MDGAAALQAQIAARYPFLTPADSVRIQQAYGTRAFVWLGDASERAALGHDFGCGLSQAEVDYLRQAEWAQTGEDILWRRSKLGLHFSDSQRAAVAAWCAAHWNDPCSPSAQTAGRTTETAWN